MLELSETTRATDGEDVVNLLSPGEERDEMTVGIDLVDHLVLMEKQ